MSSESSKAEAKPGPTVDEYDIKTGLADFYSAQADLVLTQYKNINHLLGPTNDWTAPGTYCEVLLRDLLKRSFPSHLSFDKGFIHGRRAVGDKTVHSPEIDILVHDSHNFRPYFRMDDFVIVQPEAVKGIIQVKRTMTSDVLAKGLDNVVEAKRHVRDCGRGAIQLLGVFSAVVTFDDSIEDRKDGDVSSTYANRLTNCFKEEKDAYTLPNFVGSISKIFCGLNPNPNRITYGIWPSVHEGKNVGLQVFLASMTRTITEAGFYPRFGFPKPLPQRGTVVIFERPKAQPRSPQSEGQGSPKPESGT